MSIPVVLPGAPLPTLSPAAAGTDEMRRVAEEFESVFLSEMLAPMFKGLETDGLGGGGDGEQMFRPMLVQQYAEAISRAGGIGIAESIMAELSRMQTIISEDGDGAAG